MLVLISDLHLTDERAAPERQSRGVQAIRVPKLRPPPEKRGPGDPGLVLLGDIFDFGRTDYGCGGASPRRNGPGAASSTLQRMNTNTGRSTASSWLS